MPRCPTRPVRALLVNADADYIAQVVTNYLSNAVKYSKADQPVEVRVEEGEDCQARVAVCDAGPGLPQAEQARVWEHYPRIETVAVQSDSRVSPGLGLSISKAIIERHGSEAGVESPPGKGVHVLAHPAAACPVCHHIQLSDRHTQACNGPTTPAEQRAEPAAMGSSSAPSARVDG